MGSRPIGNKQSCLQRDLGAQTHTHGVCMVQDTAYYDNMFVVVAVVFRVASGAQVTASLLWHPGRV